MGAVCVSSLRNKSNRHIGSSGETLESLRERIEIAIESLPLNYDDIIPTEGFISRGAAIEQVMRQRGYRKITPEEYAALLQKGDQSVYIWTKINPREDRNLPDEDGTKIRSAASIDTETLAIMRNGSGREISSITLSSSYNAVTADEESKTLAMNDLDQAESSMKARAHDSQASSTCSSNRLSKETTLPTNTLHWVGTQNLCEKSNIANGTTSRHSVKCLVPATATYRRFSPGQKFSDIFSS